MSSGTDEAPFRWNAVWARPAICGFQRREGVARQDRIGFAERQKSLRLGKGRRRVAQAKLCPRDLEPGDRGIVEERLQGLGVGQIGGPVLALRVGLQGRLKSLELGWGLRQLRGARRPSRDRRDDEGCSQPGAEQPCKDQGRISRLPKAGGPAGR
jgi:hypothetical protein